MPTTYFRCYYIKYHVLSLNLKLSNYVIVPLPFYLSTLKKTIFVGKTDEIVNIFRNLHMQLRNLEFVFDI